MPSIWITGLQDGLGSRNSIDSWSNEFPTFPAESQNTAMKHLESPQTWGMRTCSCRRAQVFICTFAWKRYKLTMLGEEGDENSVERDAYKYIVQQASRDLLIFSKHTEKHHGDRWPFTPVQKTPVFFFGQVGTGSRWVHLEYPRWSEIPTASVAAGGSSPAQFLDSTCRWEHLGAFDLLGRSWTLTAFWDPYDLTMIMCITYTIDDYNILGLLFWQLKDLQLQAYNLRRLASCAWICAKTCVSMPVWQLQVLQWRSISSLPWQEIGLLFFDTQNLQMEMSAERQLFMRSWLDDGWNWKAATLWESWWDRYETTDKSCWRGPAMSSLYHFLESRTQITPRKFNITNRWYPELPFERRYIFHQWTSMDPCHSTRPLHLWRCNGTKTGQISGV